MTNPQCVDTHEMGEVIDMIKDLAETCYYVSIVEAMEDKEDHEESSRQTDTMYYGIVDSEKTKITVPFGQESEYIYGGNGNPITLLGLDSELNGYDEGSLEITLTQNAAGKYSMDFNGS